MEQVKGIGDYLAILRRRKKQLFIPMLVILLLSTVVAVALPSIYQSTATILIEQQEIPKDLVRSTVTSYADQRVQIISQRVLSSANLRKIIDQFNLYVDERRTETINAIVEDMRDDIQLEMVSADVVDPRSGRPTQATIAFTLSYQSESPTLAQKVANRIVSLFLKENLKTRAETAEDTSAFLAAEAEKLSEQISIYEKRLADFKEKNAGALPELMQLNLQLMDRMERQITDVDQEVRSLQERQIYLQSELAQMNPSSGQLLAEDGSRILGPEDRLRALEAKYLSLTSRYSENHPDRIKMKREIEALRKEVGAVNDTDGLESQLKVLEAEMSSLRERYSGNHPDVKKLQRSIDSTRKALAEARAEKRKRKPRRKAKPPTNPAYIQLQTQLEAGISDLRSLKAKKDKLEARLAEYEERLTKSPQVERQYRNLTRDYENALAKYQEVKSKQMEAELSETLEKERKGERFSVVEPPQLPEEPEKPNRLAILFLGFVFSFAGGVGTVAVGESLDHSLRGPKSIVEAVQIPPLAVIPYIENDDDRKRRRRRRLLWIFGTITTIAVGLALVHFLYRPLDVLWFTILRKLETLWVTSGF